MEAFIAGVLLWYILLVPGFLFDWQFNTVSTFIYHALYVKSDFANKWNNFQADWENLLWILIYTSSKHSCWAIPTAKVEGT